MDDLVRRESKVDLQVMRLVQAIEQGKYDVNETKYFLQEVLRLIDARDVGSDGLRTLFAVWARALN